MRVMGYDFQFSMSGQVGRECFHRGFADENAVLVAVEFGFKKRGIEVIARTGWFRSGAAAPSCSLIFEERRHHISGCLAGGRGISSKAVLLQEITSTARAQCLSLR